MRTVYQFSHLLQDFNKLPVLYLRHCTFYHNLRKCRLIFKNVFAVRSTVKFYYLHYVSWRFFLILPCLNCVILVLCKTCKSKLSPNSLQFRDNLHLRPQNAACGSCQIYGCLIAKIWIPMITRSREQRIYKTSNHKRLRDVSELEQSPGTSVEFWLGGQCPLATWGEENFENLTTKWCILKYIWIDMWST